MDTAESVAFEHAPVGIVLTEDRIITACNKKFCTLTGWIRAELVGQSFRMLYASDEEFDRIRDIGLFALSTEGSYSDQRLLLRRDGSAVWCRFRAATLDPESPLSRTILTYTAIGDAASVVRLTARERDVVLGLSRGRTSKQIGRDLDLSSRTIEDVRARLLRKFDVRNAAELLEKLRNVKS